MTVCVPRLENCYRNDTASLLDLHREAVLAFHSQHYLTLIIKVICSKEN
jgi:hypothetical protein